MKFFLDGNGVTSVNGAVTKVMMLFSSLLLAVGEWRVGSWQSILPQVSCFRFQFFVPASPGAKIEHLSFSFVDICQAFQAVF